MRVWLMDHQKEGGKKKPPLQFVEKGREAMGCATLAPIFSPATLFQLPKGIPSGVIGVKAIVSRKFFLTKSKNDGTPYKK